MHIREVMAKHYKNRYVVSVQNFELETLGIIRCLVGCEKTICANPVVEGW